MLKNLFSFLFVLFMISCVAQKGDVKKLDIEEFEKQIASGNAIVLDVRTTEEYMAGHIKGALQADWNNRKEFQERTRFIDKSTGVYVYCAFGPRSAAATNWMYHNGFHQVYELNGGFINWKKKGKPIEEERSVKQMTLADYRSMIPSSGIVLIDFGAKWCPPCVKMEPILTEIKEELKNKFTLVKIEAGIHTEVQQTLGIESYPTFIIYRNGEEAWRHSGIIEKSELLSRLKH